MNVKLGHTLVLSLWTSQLWAAPIDQDNKLCPPASASSLQYQMPETFPDEQKQDTRISAMEVENVSTDMTRFKGKVLIERDKLRLQADEVELDRTQQTLQLNNNIHIDSSNMAIAADTGWLDLENNLGEFNHTRYLIPDPGLRGSTPRLSLQDQQQTLLIDSSFTSCPENKQDWQLNTSSLLLDHGTQTGTARNTVLWFKGVPIFYSPYLSFPIGDERRSGFLMPNFGRSNSSGTEISVPWYWNIAPNQDAILTPRYLSKRGNQLLTNYRFLTPSSQGYIDLEYIPDDQLRHEQRHLFKFDSHSDIGRHLNLDMLINDASDNDYLEDLGSNFNISNITHLERRAKLNYNSTHWRSQMMVQSYETIDDDIALDSHPYRRLPQITLAGSDELSGSGLRWSLESEWVQFEHESNNRDTGTRFDLYPKLSWPLLGSAWFLTPSTGIRHTAYDVIDGTSNTNLNIDDRQLSISSLDAGLFFERDVSDSTVQTLEPRLFYLYVPYEDQSSLPVFDTGDLDFSFAQLFRENRFNGIDRIGDANQVTLALSSRLLNKHTGDEFMNVSLGQIIYNQDRLVSLNATTENSSSSDFISEISGNWRHWSSRATVQYSPEFHRTDKRNIQLHYDDEQQGIFNIGYRFLRDAVDESNNIEQTDVSFAWPLTDNYTLLGRWNYSQTEKRDIDVLFGIAYESCCWAMRIVTQRYLQDDSTEVYDNALKFQLILKGLGSVTDKKTNTILKHAILGYQPEY